MSAICKCSLTAAPRTESPKVCAYEPDGVCIKLTTVVQGLRIALPAVLNVDGGTPLVCEAWGQHLLPPSSRLPCARPEALMEINTRAVANRNPTLHYSHPCGLGRASGLRSHFIKMLNVLQAEE